LQCQQSSIIYIISIIDVIAENLELLAPQRCKQYLAVHDEEPEIQKHDAISRPEKAILEANNALEDY
jgi:hypothetical protein